MKHTLLFLSALGASTMASGFCPAVTFDDYLQHGYSIAGSTIFAGTFTGCIRAKTLRFADGTTFVCAQTVERSRVNPHVYFLRQGADLPSVILIGNEPYEGVITRFGSTQLEQPFEMVIDSPEDQETATQTSGASNGLIEAVRPIESINELQNGEPALLNTAQAQPVARSPLDETDDAKGH
jgi:hypothetical protein